MQVASETVTDCSTNAAVRQSTSNAARIIALGRKQMTPYRLATQSISLKSAKVLRATLPAPRNLISGVDSLENLFASTAGLDRHV